MVMATAAESVNRGMNTIMSHRAYGRYAEQSISAAREEAARLEELLSRFRPGSEISRLNRSAGVKYEKLSDETYEVLSRAVEFSRLCKGLFDITIGPLVSLWHNCRDIYEPPGKMDIWQALSLINFNDLLFDACSKAAGLSRAGQSLDLGGIGKGFAGDKLLEIFRKYEVISAYTNIGGNVAVFGTKPDGSPWRVGIAHPRQEGSLIGFVSVADRAVVTSGDYQRYFIAGSGKRYHHIMDPFTGYPSEAGLVSVTVVAENSMAADALSTILFTAGMEKGLGLLRHFSGAEAVFVDTDLRVHITAGLKECFQAAEGIEPVILKEKEGDSLYDKQ